VTEFCDRASFSLESLHKCSVWTEVGRKNLQGYRTVERNLTSLINHTHSASTEEVLDLAVTQFGSSKLLNIHGCLFSEREEG
jgi:hypothetical protein